MVQRNAWSEALGAPGRTRTHDPLLRRQPLYPPELRRPARPTRLLASNGVAGSPVPQGTLSIPLVAVAQVVRASGCGPEGRGFESPRSPQVSRASRRSWRARTSIGQRWATSIRPPTGARDHPPATAVPGFGPGGAQPLDHPLDVEGPDRRRGPAMAVAFTLRMRALMPATTRAPPPRRLGRHGLQGGIELHADGERRRQERDLLPLRLLAGPPRLVMGLVHLGERPVVTGQVVEVAVLDALPDLAGRSTSPRSSRRQSLSGEKMSR